MDNEHLPNDLPTQLRGLGRAAEASVRPATVEDAQSPRKRPAGRILAAAAALIVIVAGSVALTTRDTQDIPLATASQPADDSDTGDTSDTGETGDTVASEWDNGWQTLRECESNGDYRTDTGNTFYGAYQFTRSTWDLSAGIAGLEQFQGTNPATAPPEVQDALAAALYLERDTDPWPICGQHIRGPMNTPVIASNLSPPDPAVAMLVFLEPSTSDDKIDATRTRVSALLADEPDVRIRYYDRDESYAEFTEMFASNPDIADAVDRSDIPTSIRIDSDLDLDLDVSLFRSLPNVMTVMDAADRPPILEVGLGRRLVVDRLGIDVPLYNQPTTTNLAQGVAFHQPARTPTANYNMMNPSRSYAQPPTRDTRFIAGYRQGPIEPFARIGELVAGDIIEVHTLLDGSRHSVQVERFAVVAATGRMETLDLPLALVTTVDDPEDRLVVWAEDVPADLGAFGIDG